MRHSSCIVLLAFLTLCSTAGCAPATSPTSSVPTEMTAPTATDTPLPATLTEPQPTPTLPTPTEPPPQDDGVTFGSWRLVARVEAPSTTFVVEFLDASFGIAVGHRGSIRVTSDGGSTWTEPERRTTARRFGLDIVDRLSAWNCGNEGHVLMTLDGGQTWQSVRSFGPDVPDHCRFLSFLDAESGWAATPRQLGATEDGGQSWRDIALPSTIQDIAAIALRTPSDGYVLDAAGDLFATHDGGETWHANTLGLEEGRRLVTSTVPMAAMRFVDGDQGVIVLQDDQTGTWAVFTADSGLTWQWEEIPGAPGRAPLFLAPDGKTLTLYDGTEAIVLRYNGPRLATPE